MLDIDIELIKKYDKPGPRYTSYPTAPHFNDSFTHEDYKAEIIATNTPENNRPLSLYFHLPFCDTLCYFCGCNMIVTRNRPRITKYLTYLKKEIDMVSGMILKERPVIQVHWGGGTPTHLEPEEITDLISYIREKFNILPDAEIGCEIDPRELRREHLEALRNGGFNRISMGVQDFNEKVQKAVNRIQPEEVTERVINWVKELGFHSYNLDLMYGLPFQTKKDFEVTVDKLIDLDPDRVAVFNYAHVPWMKKHMDLIKTEDLPAPEEKLEILKMTAAKLTSAGYEFIGMDHFAKPEDELAVALHEKKLYRNFQGYSTHAGTDLYGMGITSIGQLEKIYVQNLKTEKEYFDALDKGILPVYIGCKLNDDDILRREVITKIMCDFELDYSFFDDKYGINFREYFAYGIKKLDDFTEDGLVTFTPNGFEVNEMGRLLIRNIAMGFDGYLERKEDSGRYSRTV